MTGHGTNEWWDDEGDDGQQENRGQSKLAEPRKAWLENKIKEDMNEDSNANP